MDVFRLLNTVRYLKPIQVYRRAWFRLYRPAPDMAPVPGLRPAVGDWVESAAKPDYLLFPWRFRFLNEEHDCDFPAAWNREEWGKLWLYNLHYFDCLATAGRRELQAELIARWIADNPPGRGNGWEPYPLSLRIVNWIKWFLAGNQLSENAIQSLVVQVRFLRKRLEVHLLGNHLFANAKALIFAGLFFTGDEAQGWLNKGLEILDREVPEQILEDGGHFERSPMYHAIILDDLLDLINIMRIYGLNYPENWNGKAERMLGWLKAMTHPDGDIALFNDAAFAVAPRPDQLFAYADRLGFKATTESRDDLIHFAETGYLRVQFGSVLAFLDVAPIGPDYLPGHAHADTLNFELSMFGQRVIVDSGTSCYGISEERLRQRGTAAHNTVTINGENSSEVWGGFRVARRARSFGLQIDELPEMKRITCSHDGYCRLPGKPIHRRCWEFGAESLSIVDSIVGQFETAVARYHFHPGCNVTMYENNHVYVNLPEGESLNLNIKGGKGRLVDTTYHPEFGLSLPNQCLEIMFIENEVTICIFYF